MVQIRPKVIECRPKEVACRPKEVQCRPKEVECRPEEVECRPKEVELAHAVWRVHIVKSITHISSKKKCSKSRFTRVNAHAHSSNHYVL